MSTATTLSTLFDQLTKYVRRRRDRDHHKKAIWKWLKPIKSKGLDIYKYEGEIVRSLTHYYLTDWKYLQYSNHSYIEELIIEIIINWDNGHLVALMIDIMIKPFNSFSSNQKGHLQHLERRSNHVHRKECLILC